MKVFLSSTFQDLQEHRKRVIEAIDRLRANDAEIEWLGMEIFGARDDLPADACVKFVDACELYIGFFGVRYGTIDPKSKMSMTEVEYRRAVERKKARLIFLISDDAPIKPKDIEPDAHGHARLVQLKEELKKDRAVDFFTTPEDLAFKVATALAQKIPALASSSIIPFPPLPYFPYSYPLQANFTGRARERAQLSDWLTRGERQTESILALEAIGGMGKSALAWYWLNNDVLSLGIENFSLLGVLWWSFYDERDFSAFLTRAIEYASGGAVRAQAIASDRERIDALITLLQQKRFLIVLDGLERVLRAYARLDAAYRGDEVETDARGEYRACADPNVGIFLKRLASGALTKTLITTRLFPRELDDLAGARKIELTGIDAADAVEFFHAQKINGTRAEIISVCGEYGFHALTLRLLSGALAHDPRFNRDIQSAPKVNPLAQDKEQRILEFAYNSLAPREQKLISQLSAFRSPLTWDALAAIFTTEGTEKEKNLTTKNTKDTKKNKNKISSAPSAVRFDFANEEELARAVMDLSERGLYQRDEKANTYDLHPVIRRYCYDRLSDKTATHARFVMYFEKIETPRKISSLADLQPTIELYHHTVRAGRYTEAEVLFFDRLHNPLYYQLGAYQNIIELLRALFPQGNESLPPLDTDDKKAFTLNSLANSYSLSGQPRRAVPVFEQAYLLAEKMGNKKNLAIGLVNVADDQLKIGELAAAERNQRRSIEICREIKEEFYEADGHREFGRVLAYRGEFAEAEKELNVAFEIFGKQNVVQSQSVVSAYRALRALLMGNASAALDAAHKAREFAEEWERTTHRNERDFIRAEWLIGAALVAGSRGEAFAQAHSKSKTPGSIPITLPDNYTLANASPLQRAEHHLQEALARDRAINLVESEAEILLELARLRKSQAMTMDDGRKTENGSVVGQPSAVALMQESFNFANEALEIAERCEYRLQQAEIQNFLAEWHWQMADSRWQIAESGKQKAESRDEWLAKARAHAERARECARCDGPPHYYKVAFEKAERMLEEMAAG